MDEAQNKYESLANIKRYSLEGCVFVLLADLTKIIKRKNLQRQITKDGIFNLANILQRMEIISYCYQSI